MDIFTQPTYCNVSSNHIIHGAMCEFCGICVEDCNMKIANKRIRCKELSSRSVGRKHHWVKGNLPLCSTCNVCEDHCGNLPSLCDYRCLWCMRTVHEKCLKEVPDPCDLGRHKTVIVPPECVVLKRVGIKGRRHYIVDSVQAPPEIEGWHPLVVIANRKSGNGDGEHILRDCRKLLNPAQVIDLAELSPECALEWCHLIPTTTCRVLIAGGDGTVGWVLHAIDKLKLNPYPQIAILPLGTGNDLSRVLGWGEGYVGEIDMEEIFYRVEAAEPVSMDRWKIDIKPAKHFGFRYPSRTYIMNNYASVGVDALVTLNFHKQRERMPGLFTSRIINKLWYFTYGTKDVLERECKTLNKKLTVELDGCAVDLPDIEGLVILNISSWGGGCRPWELGKGDSVNPAPKPKYNDGLVEVFALYSSFHIAQLQVGLAEPLRLGQASSVTINLFGGNAPMQVDGEPWEQHPATITITPHASPATMLRAPE